MTNWFFKWCLLFYVNKLLLEWIWQIRIPIVFYVLCKNVKIELIGLPRKP